MTPTENYILDRDALRRGWTNDQNRREQAKRSDFDRLFRTYQRALFSEMKRQSLRRPTGNVFRYRSMAGDDELPVPFPAYWQRQPAEALLELWDTLVRARWQGPASSDE